MKWISWDKYSDDIEQRSTYRHEFSARLILQHNPKRVLDVGCGIGVLTAFMPSDVFSVGIENTQKSAMISVANGFRTVIVADASKLPFRNMSFDAVSMLEILEHIPINRELICLNKIYRVMSVNSIVTLSVPYGSWKSKILDPGWMFGHRHYFESDLEKLFLYAGCVLKETQIKGGFWELLAMLNLYVCKWIFGRAMLGQPLFERKRKLEYEIDNQGFATLFVVGKK